MIRCNNADIFVRYGWGRRKKYSDAKKKKKKRCAVKKYFTSSKFLVVLQLLDIIFDLKNFIDIEERRRRRLTIVFPRDGMEDHWEFF